MKTIWEVWIEHGGHGELIVAAKRPKRAMKKYLRHRGFRNLGVKQLECWKFRGEEEWRAVVKRLGWDIRALRIQVV